jgi:ADP-ribosyl-[dinitrogen reductase] hydrolase
MERYLKWRDTGHLSSTDTCFDIGRTVESALERFRATGEPFAGPTDPQTAGNGSLMRLAPIALYYHPNVELVLQYAAESSRTTHGAPEAVECCKLLAYLLTRALEGAPKAALLDASALPLSEPRVAALARGDFARKTRDEIAGTGYCVSSLEAALWSFRSTDSFAAAILAAANLGDDADTTAAITGQIAGAFYGFDAIPRPWLARLALADFLVAISQVLYLRADLRLARERANLDP